MESAKLSYPGIVGAVAGVVGLLGVYARWFSVALSDGSVVTVNGTADNSGKLALAMSIALFAFSACYILLDDARIRRAMAALMILTSVVLTLSVVWAITRADGMGAETGLFISGLGGVLGIAAGLLTMKDPVDPDRHDEIHSDEDHSETHVPANAAS